MVQITISCCLIMGTIYGENNGKNLWGKYMGKINGENYWEKLMGKNNEEK